MKNNIQHLKENCGLQLPVKLWILLILLFFLIPEKSFSQNFVAVNENEESEKLSSQVSQDKGQQSLKHFLDQLGRLNQVSFVFEDKLIENRFVKENPKVVSDIKELRQALTNLLDPLGLKFEISGSFYVIQPKEKNDPDKVDKIEMKTIPENKEGYSLYQVQRLEQMALDLQVKLDKTIRGQVTDENNAPLPGVNIIVQNTTIGTVTDIDGNYRLNVPDDAVTLVFTSVGYTREEVDINNRNVINISMVPDVQSLSEVVVVGYGTVKKSDLTGSVTSLKAEDINRGVNTSMDQLLKGRAAGVNVVQNSSEPGGGVSISIRGASSINAGTGPLYVIDGLPIDNSALTGGSGGGYPDIRTPTNPLSSINPSDIESIEILKDASATAIYGSRGANGVILITTKKGRKGEMEINYDGYVGVQNVIKKLDLLTPQEYQTVLNDLIDNGGGLPEQRVTEIVDGGTDWQEEIFRTNAPVQNHNFSFSGGSERTKYFASLNYFNQQGVVVSSAFRRYSGRLNLESEFSDKFSIGLNLNTSYNNNDLVPAQSFGVNENNGTLYAAYNFDPTLPVKDENGDYVISEFISIDNPLALAYGKNAMVETYRTFATIFGNYQVLPSLSFRLNVGTDVTNQRKDIYVNRLTKDGLANNGIATILQDLNSNYLVEGTATYDKTIDIHHLNVLAGITAQKFTRSSTNMNGSNFPSDATGTFNVGLGDPTQYNIGSFKATNGLQSYIGRVNYSLLDKYLLTATLRIDGSSRFGENNKFGYFPSAAFAWKLKEEPFMAGIEPISTLKFRASWGQTGNQEIGNYLSLTTFGQGPTAVFDDQQVSTTDPSRLANPDLKWETTEQWDIGFDFGFIKDRIYGSVDYYNKSTFDMLLALPVPTSTGYTSRLTNVGSIRNTGFELTINSVNVEGDFSWNTNFNIATVNNEVTDLGGIPRIVAGNAGFTSQLRIIEEGKTLNSFYGYQIDGIWQEGDNFEQTTDPVQPGALKFRDINGDSTVNADDRMILGNSFPDVTVGFGNNFTYKGLSLYVFIEGVKGISMLNNNLVDSYFPINFRRNKFAEPYLNRWTPENPSNVYPSFINPTAQGQKQVNSYTVQDASYLRLRTISLSYNLPQFSNFIRTAQIYFTADNLITITNYDGMDPAVNPNGNFDIRIDYNAYPTTTNFLVGVKLGL